MSWGNDLQPFADTYNMYESQASRVCCGNKATINEPCHASVPSVV